MKSEAIAILAGIALVALLALALKMTEKTDCCDPATVPPPSPMSHPRQVTPDT